MRGFIPSWPGISPAPFMSLFMSQRGLSSGSAESAGRSAKGSILTSKLLKHDTIYTMKHGGVTSLYFTCTSTFIYLLYIHR